MSETDCITSIADFNAGLDPERLALKFKAMRSNAFVFFRGTCHLFYERLPDLGDLAKAPTSWNCGDLHLENFGSFKGENGLVYFDMNDFDEALLAPCIWDLIRVVASIRLARAGMGIKKSEIDALCASFVAAYAAALQTGKAFWIERETAGGIIGSLLAGLKGKGKSAQLAGRTEQDGKELRLRLDGIHALKCDKKSASHVQELFDHFQSKQPKSGRLTVEHIARRIAGTGSLGLERYVLLVKPTKTKKNETKKNETKKIEDYSLVDLKVSRPSSSQKRCGLEQYGFGSEATRVVSVQRMMQAVSPGGLSAIIEGDKSYVLRALQPREDRLDLALVARNSEGLQAALDMMARLVAWAQLRSSGRKGSATADDLVVFASGGSWQAEVLRLAQESAELAQKDWETYSAAYDAKRFDPLFQ